MATPATSISSSNWNNRDSNTNLRSDLLFQLLEGLKSWFFSILLWTIFLRVKVSTVLTADFTMFSLADEMEDTLFHMAKTLFHQSINLFHVSETLFNFAYILFLWTFDLFRIWIDLTVKLREISWRRWLFCGSLIFSNRIVSLDGEFHNVFFSWRKWRNSVQFVRYFIPFVRIFVPFVETQFPDLGSDPFRLV